MRFRGIVLSAGVLLVLAVLTATPVGGQGISREQADAILQELRAIRQLLERGPGPSAQRGAAPAPARDERVTLPPASAWELGRRVNGEPLERFIEDVRWEKA